MQNTAKKTLVAMCSLAMLWSCSGSSAPPKMKPANPTTPPQGLGGSNGGGTPISAPNTNNGLPAGNLTSARYKVTVNAVLGDVCSGHAEIKIRSDMTIEVPEAYVGCFLNSCKLDLKGSLGGLSGGGLFQGAVVQGPVLRSPQMRGATFTPPRPIFITPFNTPIEQIGQVNITENITLNNPDGFTDSGTVNMAVTSVDQPFQSTVGNLTFPKTVQWHVKNDGFANAKAVAMLPLLLFDETKLVWALEPTIAIPKIEIRGNLGAFMSGSGGGGLSQCPMLSSMGGGGGLIGVIVNGVVQSADFKLTLEIMEQEGLRQDY